MTCINGAPRVIGYLNDQRQLDSNTALHVLGYFPGISFVSGIARTIWAGCLLGEHKAQGCSSNFPCETSWRNVGQIFRGLMEIAGAGLLFLLADLICLVYQACTPRTIMLG